MVKNLKISDFLSNDSKLKQQLKKVRLQDAGVATAFVGAIAILLLVACYVISRLSSERAYRNKWQDYNDCGWA